MYQRYYKALHHLPSQAEFSLKRRDSLQTIHYLAVRQTEKPGAVRFPVRQGIFLPGQYFLTAPACSCVHRQLHARAATPLFGHTIILDTLGGMGSATLAAAVHEQAGEQNFLLRD